MEHDDGFAHGCIIPEVLAPAIEFSSILSEDFVGESAWSAGPALSIPESANHLKPFSRWEVLGNKQYNNCNAVAWANTRRLVTSKLSEQEVYPTQDEVYQFYKTQNPEFDPKFRNRAADRGMLIQQSLDHLVSVGQPDGRRALAFARVDPTNVDNVRMALATFGSIWLGVRVFPTNTEQLRKGQPWTLPAWAEEKPFGHAVVAGAYDPDFQIVTWGEVVTLGADYWHGRCKNAKGEDAPVVFEAYVVVWPEHIGTRRFMNGVSLQQLADQYFKLTNKDMRIPIAQFNSLFHCQTTGGHDTLVTLQKFDAETSYASVTVNKAVEIEQSDVRNGAFAVESNDLFFIKTRETTSNKIEVRRIQDPAYNKVEAWISGFDTTHGRDKLWTIDNGDLYCIEYVGTESGMVEVNWASHQDHFKTPIHYTSGMKTQDTGFGTYAISGGNLYMILDADNDSGTVEVDRAMGYTKVPYGTDSIEHYTTGFKINDVRGKGTWSIGHNGDLFLIKTSGTESGMVELHVATLESNYQNLTHYSIAVPAVQSGVWMIY